MHRLLTAFYAAPWAMTDEAFSAAEMLLQRWAAGVRLSNDQIEAAVGGAPEAAAARRAQMQEASGGGVQIIPIYGVMAHRAYAVANTSRPLTSTEAIASAVRAAAADPNVGTIVLDVDSPGGSVSGTNELADTVAAARTVKPVIAVANSEAASAAYWVAAQASEIVVTPSGMVGSIGVRMPYVDTTEKDAKAGIKTEFISYGKYKSEGMSGPLTDETRAYLQQMVDAYGAQFTRAVAKGRGVPVDVVRGPAFGEGRMKVAADAVASGMADRIGTLEDVIAEARKPKRRPTMTSARAARDIQILET
ncbi:MAG: hypothetical protein RJA36_2688 [Pseudomonadota bacterium]|jgi:signal peptide peptidase SppA